MNQNFMGAPDKEDLRLLDSMRRQLLPMIAVMEKLKVEMEFKMSRGEAVDWPQIHRTTNTVTNYLSSFNMFMYGGYKHSSIPTTERRQVPKQDENGNVIMNDDGTPVLISKDFPKTTYSDTAIQGQAERVRVLHPFPMPPFPMMQGGAPGPAAGLANTLLRKRLEAREEEWVDKRLRKASEFAHVPGEWGIEPRKLETKDEVNNADSDVDEEDDERERLPTKRIKEALNEDDILELWKYAHQEAFDHQYLKSKYPEEYGEGEGEGEGESPGDDEDEDDEEDDAEFEDTMNTSGAPETATILTSIQASAQPAEPSTAPINARGASPIRHPIHQAIAGLPILSLGSVHRFMTSGEVSGQ